jgi:hypothetical protein
VVGVVQLPSSFDRSQMLKRISRAVANISKDKDSLSASLNSLSSSGLLLVHNLICTPPGIPNSLEINLLHTEKLKANVA